MSAALERWNLTETSVTIAARDLLHRYGRRAGLERTSFSLTAPGVVAVTGPNGVGKSTLLRILAGLLRPSAGSATVTIGGRALTLEERRRLVGYAGPELSFYEEFAACENLTFVAEARGMSAPRAVAQAALERVGLGSRAADRVAGLSSGMKQRLRLAFALLHSPPALLLDEPSSHLDEEGRSLLSGLVRQQGQSGLVVIATNDERECGLAEQRIELRGRGLGHSA